MAKDKKHHEHSSHKEAVTRLKRADGHLLKVVEMIEHHKPCADILQQLSAVISALSSCRLMLLQDHLDTCLAPALKPGHEHVVAEIETIVKRAMKGS